MVLFHFTPSIHWLWWILCKHKKNVPQWKMYWFFFWESELVKPFLCKKILPRNHRNSLKSHVSCYLEMQRSEHFNIFYHILRGRINKEGEELQVFDFFFPQEATSKITALIEKRLEFHHITDANTMSLGSSLWHWCQSAHCHCPWHQEPQLHL